MKYLLGSICIMLLFITQMSFGLEADQVRGEVVEVLPDSNELKIRITEAGDELPGREGEIETYYVPEGTKFEYEVDSVLYGLDTNPTLADLSEGDKLVLDFDEVDQRRQARNVRNEETQNVAMRDRVQSEGTPVDDDRIEVSASNRSDELPESASVLPLLALAGVLFAVLGGAVRRLRR